MLRVVILTTLALPAAELSLSWLLAVASIFTTVGYSFGRVMKSLGH